MIEPVRRIPKQEPAQATKSRVWWQNSLGQRNPPSSTVRMALTNNQSVQKVVYLVRYAEAYALYWLAGTDGAVGWYYQGLLVQNVGAPPFGASGKDTCRRFLPIQTRVPPRIT